jgi:hypothetical protein
MKKQKKQNLQNKFKLEMDKQTLEVKKEHFNRLIETIVQYAFKEIAHTAVGFEELWRNETQRNYSLIENSNLTKEQKDELKHFVMPIFYTDEELKEKQESGLSDEHFGVLENIKYYEKQIALAEELLDHLPSNVKKKIVLECITQRYMWIKSLEAYCKIEKAKKDNLKGAKKK